jgi:hypothetical protein
MKGLFENKECPFDIDIAFDYLNSSFLWRHFSLDDLIFFSFIVITVVFHLSTFLTIKFASLIFFFSFSIFLGLILFSYGFCAFHLCFVSYRFFFYVYFQISATNFNNLSMIVWYCTGLL